jgi:glycosyltransferase involved in cell wall biosynthesis
VRVALVYDSFGLVSSLERELVLMARELAVCGVDVHVYTNVDERTADVPGVTLHDVGHPVPSDGRLRHPWHYVQFARRATHTLKLERKLYDVVSVWGTTAWEHDVIRVHAVEQAEQRRWPERGGQGYRFARVRAFAAPVLWPKVGAARRIERLQFRPGRFKLAHAVTESVARDLREVHSVPDDRIEVIPLPIEPHAVRDGPSIRKRLRLRASDRLALFVGHDFARKGLGDAIAGVAALDDTVHLVVVGAGNRSPYERIAERCGNRDRVHFLGATDKPEGVFHEADFLLLPTHEDVWGIVVIEAMAAGLPVVTTSVAGASVAVRSAQAGVIVEDTSVATLRNAIVHVLDPQRRQMMGEHGRTGAARFHAGRVAREMLVAYERICAGR